MHRVLRTAAAVVAGTALTFSVVAASELPASAATGCKATFSSYKTIQKGTRGAQARVAQCLINRAGYRMKADGSFSASDSTKLKKFQRTHDVNVTGKVTASSWTALISRGSKPTLRIGSRGASVTRLQNALTASGRHVPATGTYGTLTANAVKSVQRARHRKATGIADTAVWNLLQAGDPMIKKAAKKPAPKKTVKATKTSSKAAKAVAFAKKQIGDRYRYGATGPSSWDCSGLTMGSWKSAGVKLPHQARQQWKKGKKVSKSNLKPGDLVFYYSGISHVGIYVGGGKIVHASRPGKPVGYAKVNSMPYQGARRVA